MDHDTVTDAALDARYRQRRLFLLLVLVGATVGPIVALGTWWLWPLLVVPAALAAPLAGGTGMIATLLASVLALAVASSGDVASAEVATGLLAIIVVAGLGAAHTRTADARLAVWPVRSVHRGSAVAPHPVFDRVADRDCRRAAEAGSPVSVVVVAVPRLDSVGRIHGREAHDALLVACSAAITGAASGSDVLADEGGGRYVALVAGGADAARDLGERMAMALEGVVIRGGHGLRVTAGAAAVGVAQWTDGDTEAASLIERAGADLTRDLMRQDAAGSGADQITGEFRRAAAAA